MKIEKLYSALENITKNKDSIFKNSGMFNKFRTFDYGFFPLGLGLLSNDRRVGKLDEKNYKVMILGNDFGTLKYLKTCEDNKAEASSNSTINNLLTKLNLAPNSTFYTNFHLGVRIQGTNTIREVELKENYKELCFKFFIKQLEIINPNIVICLGHAVRLALVESSSLFNDWNYKNKSIKKFYESKTHKIEISNNILGNRKFILSPHPCYSINFKQYYVDEIIRMIQYN